MRDALVATTRANLCAPTLSIDGQPGVPWCQFPLFAAAGWFSTALNETTCFASNQAASLGT